MGSSGNQQQVGQQKAQKGWLSRWTRKQWSRHWFVLKNGSLTYYRGPAAELCSFLDGVLDLSLIKHIEVPQQEEQVVLGHHHHHYNHLSQPQSVVNFNCGNQQQSQQQEHQQRFNFSLKMWNGECHLLSASSSSERQLWLAAINSCNNYDDETASSDSSSSSQSSNISTKSADIGSSHHSSCVVVPAPPSACQMATQLVSIGTSRTSSTGTNPNLVYQQQQQQEKEAEISLEQLALKLKSVVRRRRDTDSLEPDDAQEQQQQQQPTQQQTQMLIARQKSINSSQRSSNSKLTSQHLKQYSVSQTEASENPSDKMRLEDSVVVAHQQTGNDEQREQAYKRRLVCLQTPADSPDQIAMPVDDGEVVRSGDRLERPEVEIQSETGADEAGDEGKKEEDDDGVDDNDDGEEDDNEENDDEESARGSQTCTSDSEDHSMDSSLIGRPIDCDRELEVPKGKDEEPAVASQQRQKKRVTFDLSNQSVESSSAATSSEEEDDGDEEEDVATLSSVSASTSEDEEDEEGDEDEEPSATKDETRISSSSTGESTRVLSSTLAANNSEITPEMEGSAEESQRRREDRHLFDYGGIKRIEMRRRLELREQLRYSKQKSIDEDEDSTCELVRKMIERRKLRLQNKDGAGGRQQNRDCDRENDGSGTVELLGSCVGADSAISSTRMETSQDEDDEKSDVGDLLSTASPTTTTTTTMTTPSAARTSDISQNELLTKQLELEMRLKAAEFNADLLEKRLNDSYQSYNQLEISYKQLQMELIECREMNAQNMAQMQIKIDELTSELKLSELKLLEAREKHEQHLARWQLMNGQQQQQLHPQKPMIQTEASHGPTRKSNNNWLTKNYSNSMLMSTSSGNKLLMNLASSLNQQAMFAGGPSQVMHHVKQTLSINQQQLSLKLLSQSKQIQRKLNELELKVDKIQNSGSGSNNHSNSNNNNNHHLINFDHQTVTDASQRPATSQE